MAERLVTLVHPRILLPTQIKESRKQRVSAYARVSTGSEEQLGSVEAQKDYFEKLIRQRPDWEFVGIYADEGISSTSLNRQEAFNRMIADALEGKIDFIITKSLSRFARNSLELKFNDSLWHTVIRHIVVYNDEYLIFHFKTGHEISIKI